MIAITVNVKFMVGKAKYFVEAEREGAKSEIVVTIQNRDCEVLDVQRIDRKEAFGSGVCRAALKDYLHRQKHGGPLMRFDNVPRLKPSRAKRQGKKSAKSQA